MNRQRPPNALSRAFDEAHFGDGRTLNLRDRLPTGPEAAARAEMWLRSKQVEGTREVLIITGRGANSVGGLPVIRPQVAKRLAHLKRAGVVESVSEHTAGSYIVRLATVSTMLAASQRSAPRPHAGSRAHTPSALTGLTPSTQRHVRELAVRTLASLGINDATPAMLADELQRQVELLTRAKPDNAEREEWVRGAALRALSETE